ncbi:uncharacterized protein LOC125659811 [Ostrea edulis]|uniref:uncharacterized protein LOC125659811 n=1 Tax=Ostrea edulis TaxID=37623 RepID=UPI0024AEA2F0|nr:uncharacterized protein LOC125659811 [Ostrea edulis]
MKTGGGSLPVELDALQDKVVGIIGNLIIDGLPGRHDTAEQIEESVSLVNDSSERTNAASLQTSECSVTLLYRKHIPGKQRG